MTMAAGQNREGAPPPPSLDPIVLPSTDDHKIAFGDRIPITYFFYCELVLSY